MDFFCDLLIKFSWLLFHVVVGLYYLCLISVSNFDWYDIYKSGLCAATWFCDQHFFVVYYLIILLVKHI